jgi:8-oxo-dGTP pyrophosphatase MutT (NUDIX family)
MLGRQAAGHLNGGLAYFPGGFLDLRDTRDDGTIDIDASVERELAEETGLDPSRLQRKPGYVIACQGRHISIGVAFQSDLDRDDLLAVMRSGIGHDREQELNDIVPVASMADAAAIAMPEHARVLLSHVLRA